MVESLKKGDKVVTSGGITGVISRVIDNDKVEVEIADNVTVEVIRGTGIQSLMNLSSSFMFKILILFFFKYSLISNNFDCSFCLITGSLSSSNSR